MSRKILRKSSTLIISLLVVLSCFALTGCEKKLSRTFFAADTVCTITLYDDNEEALDGAVNLCNDLCNMFDVNLPTSPIYKLNNAGVLENPDPHIVNVLNYALNYAKNSGGIFDPTVRPFTALWNFENKIIPSKDELDKAANLVGYKRLSVTQEKITLEKGAQLELGAIAKGYISDQILNYLKAQKVTSAIINLGGNVTLLGNNNGQKFSVGIRDPKSQNIIATVSAEDCSVVTSGTYQRYFETDGVTYHHLLNSKTGMPEQNSLSSVTVITKHGADADALSTVCFLFGLEKGIEYIESLPDAEAIFIDKDNSLHLTNGLEINSKNQININ